MLVSSSKSTHFFVGWFLLGLNLSLFVLLGLSSDFRCFSLFSLGLSRSKQNSSSRSLFEISLFAFSFSIVSRSLLCLSFGFRIDVLSGCFLTGSGLGLLSKKLLSFSCLSSFGLCFPFEKN